MAVTECGSITVFIMGEIGTDENLGNKTGGDRPREHCMSIIIFLSPQTYFTSFVTKNEGEIRIIA